MSTRQDRGELVSASPAQAAVEEQRAQARARKDARKGGRTKLAPKVCQVCGAEFQPKFGIQKCCSPACATVARKAAASRPRPQRRVARAIGHCVTCGSEFQVEPMCREKYCSRACYERQRPRQSPEAVARLRKQMSKRVGAANPNYKHGKRSGEKDRAGEERWYAVFAGACQNPDCPGESGPLALHHVVYRQHVERAGGDRWDPRNALTLCGSCHTSHHRRGRVLNVSALRQGDIQFALELLGDRATGYFQRYYRAPLDWALEKDYDQSVGEAA